MAGGGAKVGGGLGAGAVAGFSSARAVNRPRTRTGERIVELQVMGLIREMRQKGIGLVPGGFCFMPVISIGRSQGCRGKGISSKGQRGSVPNDLPSYTFGDWLRFRFAITKARITEYSPKRKNAPPMKFVRLTPPENPPAK